MIKYDIIELDNKFVVVNWLPKTKMDAFFRQEGLPVYRWFDTKKEAEDFILIEKLSQ